MGSLPNHTPVLHHTAPPTIALLGIEHVPKPERLVSSAGDDGTAIWAHGKVQHSVRVTCQRNNLAHARVLPDIDRVLAVSVRAHELRCQSREEQVADLGSSVVRADEVRV